MARSFAATTRASLSLMLGCWIPTRQQSSGSARPRTTTSPPALTAKSRIPASSRIETTRSTLQPLTRPDGSTVVSEAARASKNPSVATRSWSHCARIARTSGCASATASSPRLMRLISLSSPVGAEARVDRAELVEGLVQELVRRRRIAHVDHDRQAHDHLDAPQAGKRRRHQAFSFAIAACSEPANASLV